MTHPPKERVETFVAGAADRAARVIMEAHLARCPACRESVETLRREAGGLPQPDAASVLPEDGFERLWRRAEALPRTEAHPLAGLLPAEALAEIPAAGKRWFSMFPRPSRYTVLLQDPDTGSALYLSHYPRDSEFPMHKHLGLEENVILTGGYQNGETHVDAGDWVPGEIGTSHAPKTLPEEECFCLTRVEAPGLLLHGWRGALQRALTALGLPTELPPASAPPVP